MIFTIFVEQLRRGEENCANLHEDPPCRPDHTEGTKSFADGTWCIATPSQSHPPYKQPWACVEMS